MRLPYLSRPFEPGQLIDVAFSGVKVPNAAAKVLSIHPTEYGGYVAVEYQDGIFAGLKTRIILSALRSTPHVQPAPLDGYEVRP